MIGVLGCMAERLKHELLDVKKLADLVVGPDAYRDLPRLLDIVQVNTHDPVHCRTITVLSRCQSTVCTTENFSLKHIEELIERRVCADGKSCYNSHDIFFP